MIAIFKEKMKIYGFNFFKETDYYDRVVYYYIITKF